MCRRREDTGKITAHAVNRQSGINRESELTGAETTSQKLVLKPVPERGNLKCN